MSHLVSFILPAFGTSEELAATLHSVVQQDHTDFEILIGLPECDPDQASRVKEGFSSMAQLRWIPVASRTRTGAINELMPQAKGTYLSFLAPGDLLTPAALSRAVAALVSHSHWLMVFGRIQVVASNGQVLSEQPNQAWEPSATSTDALMMTSAAVIFRRSAKILMGPLDPQSGQESEFRWWLKAASQFPKRIGFLSSVQAQQPSDRESTGFRQRNWRELLKITEEYLEDDAVEKIRAALILSPLNTLKAVELLNLRLFVLDLDDEAKRRFTPPMQQDSWSPLAQDPRLKLHHFGDQFTEGISCGSFCQTAFTLRQLDYRAKTSPFDWIFCSPEIAAHAILDDFQAFLDPSHYEPVPLENRTSPETGLCDHTLYRDHYGVRHLFNHHLPTQPRDHEYFGRAAQNFRMALSAEGYPLFVMLSQGAFSLERCQSVLDALNTRCQNFLLLAINFNMRPVPDELTDRVRELASEPNFLALDLAVDSRSNGVIFKKAIDNHRFSRLLSAFPVKRHPR